MLLHSYPAMKCYYHILVFSCIATSSAQNERTGCWHPAESDGDKRRSESNEFQGAPLKSVVANIEPRVGLVVYKF